MISKFNLIVVLLLNVKSKTFVESMFTSLAEMEILIDTEEKLIKTLEDFIKNEKENLGIVERFLNHAKREHSKASQDVMEYLANPINAYTLIKRFHIDLPALEVVIRTVIGFKKNRLVKYPTEDDLTTAAVGLVRLQVTYDLDITQLANGILNYSSNHQKRPFVEMTLPMISSDCYELGQVPDRYQDSTTKLMWMKEALNKRRGENCSHICMIKKLDIIDYIRNLYNESGDIKNTIIWIKKRVALSPNSKETIKQVKLMKQLQKKLNKEQQLKTNSSTHDGQPLKYPEKAPFANKLIRNVCNSNIKIRRDLRNRLLCSYVHGPYRFLVIAPVKMELLHVRPKVVLFHEMISDTEIRILQYMAIPKLKNVRITEKDILENRHSSVAYMDERTEYVKRVVHRASSVTGFKVEECGVKETTALKVVNYGVGGHYPAHYDFYSTNNTADQLSFLVKGDKVATVMFYLSEVEEGGATVFRKLGLKVHPVKGAALFWINLHPSGDGNYNTRHEGCPVLRGSKWIALKWAREADQKICPMWVTADGIMTEERYMNSVFRESFRDERFLLKVGRKLVVETKIK